MPPREDMPDPVISPDGKFMWTGDEWIPVPPSTEPQSNELGEQSLNMQDSVIGGDVVHSTVINNDPAAVTSAVIEALQQMGMIGKTSEATPPPPSPKIELPAAFKVGDHVEYHSPTNERWLDRCTVAGINDDGTYRIEVPKSSGIETKHAVVIGSAPGTIRPAAPPYKTGDRVLVNWKNHGTYFPGTIASENDEHLFRIHYDDGDVEDGVEWSRIETLVEESSEVQEYVQHISEEENELIEAFKVFDENGTGTISAKKFFGILTEMGDDPLSVEQALAEFAELGIEIDSQIDYRELAKFMASSEPVEETVVYKPEVIIRDAEIVEGGLCGHAYNHPNLGEGPVMTSQILGIQYDERATAKVETGNTIYVVGPTGWKVLPEGHPFNSKYSVGEKVKVEWKGSWFDASILANDGERYHISYIGYDSSWDEWVGPERIKNSRYSVGEHVKVEWNGSWFDASILAINGEQYHISYIGYDSSWDEWVGPERIQKTA